MRRVPLVNSEGIPVETVAQAIAELSRLRTPHSDDTLPRPGRTPTFADYADVRFRGAVRVIKSWTSSRRRV